MLKISVVQTDTKRHVVLEGKLIAPWTDELSKICDRQQDGSQIGELVIDIRGLTVIGREGEDVLLALMQQGAKFRGSDVFTKQILRGLARRPQKPANGSKPEASNLD